MRGLCCRNEKGLAGACLWVEPGYCPVDSAKHVRKEIDLHVRVQDRPEQTQLLLKSGLQIDVGATGPDMHARDM